MKKLLYIVLAVIICLGIGGWYLVGEADAAGPDNFLYPIDLAAEAVERLVTFDEVALAELEAEILDERVEELEVLADADVIDEELILGATEKVDTQRARTQSKIDSGEGEMTGAMEEVQNRYEVKAQEHIKVMEKVQTQVEGEDTKLKVKETVSGFENSIDKGSSDSSSDSGSSGNGNN